MAKRNRKFAQHRNSFLRSQLSLERLEARELMAADLVFRWNDATMAALRADLGSANPGDGSRVFALVHTAIYDAVNAITKEYSSFALTTEAPAWASKEAAVATAARDVLAGLFPAQAGGFTSLWQQDLAAIPNGAAENEGVKIGHDAATTILNLRADDGSNDDSSNYVITDGPGHWDVDPLNPNQVAWGPNWGAVSPLAMRHASDFGAPPPPALGSPEYAAAYNEVKSLGALNSTTRTADQTEIGIFWGYDRPGFGPPTILYNQNVQDIAEAKGNTLEENARLFAMVNVAMADAGVATWKVKFDYDFWRPVTAIREGDTDGNPLTVADPNWIPLGAPGPNPNASTDDFTPPFPAYTSGHAAFGAATFKTLANFYGSDNFNYQLTSDELPGVVRNYNSFSQAAHENGRSRIYLGVHWEFDNTFSQTIGNGIADYVTDHMFVGRDDNSVLVMLQRHDAGYKTIKLPAGTQLDVQVKGNAVRIINNHTGVVLYEEPLADVAAIRIDQRNDATDFVQFNVASGSRMPDSIVVEVVGDRDWFDGVGVATGSTADTVVVGAGHIHAFERLPVVHLYGNAHVSIDTGAGNDLISMQGDQAGRQVDLLGGSGNDWYEIFGKNALMFLADTDGSDYFNFMHASSAIDFDLSRNQGHHQYAAGGNQLYYWGEIEHVYGTAYNDQIRGNWQNNYIHGWYGNNALYGGGANDHLLGMSGIDLLMGEGGDDYLEGGENVDLILGGDGNDSLFGGNGADILLGGRGKDSLWGGAGDDLIIHGHTAHDGNLNALWSIAAEWTCGRSRREREANLKHGAGTRLNGNNYLNSSTVWDDREYDWISKGNGDAWVFNGNSDSVNH